MPEVAANKGRAKDVKADARTLMMVETEACRHHVKLSMPRLDISP